MKLLLRLALIFFGGAIVHATWDGVRGRGLTVQLVVTGCVLLGLSALLAARAAAARVYREEYAKTKARNMNK